MKILSVVGARPNFMKVAPIIRALKTSSRPSQHVLVHTGQHYDEGMSGSFFEALGLPKPDFNLSVGSGSHAEQTARVMLAIEPVLNTVRPDIMLVVGDVNSTLAAALTAKKLLIRVGHVEAGLRSGDMTMPEEINRLCTDAIADDLFTTDRIANENLKREGVADERIHFVGNVMIDTLLAHKTFAETLQIYRKFSLKPMGYALLTLHRPSNVEHAELLARILDTIKETLNDLPVIFPIHPRTRSRIENYDLGGRFTSDAGKPGIFLTEPLGYLEFLSLSSAARLILTDSGGLQEESTILGVPCVTLRENTERPITVDEGTNHIAGVTSAGIRSAITQALAGPPRSIRRPDRWDGMAAERIVEIILGVARA